jgi:hypothetical protein
MGSAARPGPPGTAAHVPVAHPRRAEGPAPGSATDPDRRVRRRACELPTRARSSTGGSAGCVVTERPENLIPDRALPPACACSSRRSTQRWPPASRRGWKVGLNAPEVIGGLGHACWCRLADLRRVYRRRNDPHPRERAAARRGRDRTAGRGARAGSNADEAGLPIGGGARSRSSICASDRWAGRDRCAHDAHHASSAIPPAGPLAAPASARAGLRSSRWPGRDTLRMRCHPIPAPSSRSSRAPRDVRRAQPGDLVLLDPSPPSAWSHASPSSLRRLGDVAPALRPDSSAAESRETASRRPHDAKDPWGIGRPGA